MSDTFFFEPKGPFNLSKLLENIPKSLEKTKIFDIKTLDLAKSKDITFLNSIDYKEDAIKTKASACITKKSLEQFLPKKCIKIFVKNVLFSTAQVSKKFYPNADLDYPDKTLLE